MTKTLSIHLGGDIYFQIDGQWIDAPIDLEQFNEFEGGDPMKFYGTILEWAKSNGITHIEDDNFVEMGIHNEPTLLSLQEYGDLIRDF
jgi:hypothetical protein